MRGADVLQGERVGEEVLGKLVKDFNAWREQGGVDSEGDTGASRMGFNRVVLVGHLTDKPRLRTLPSGSTVADMNLASSESFKSKKGGVLKSTCFVDVVVWGKIAETCWQQLGKGSAVLVEGRLQLDRWETDKGEKRNKIRVRADRVTFLDRMDRAVGDRKKEACAPVVSSLEDDPEERVEF